MEKEQFEEVSDDIKRPIKITVELPNGVKRINNYDGYILIGKNKVEVDEDYPYGTHAQMTVDGMDSYEELCRFLVAGSAIAHQIAFSSDDSEKADGSNES